MSEYPKPIYLSYQDLEQLEVSTGESIAGIESMIRGQAESRVWAAPKSALLPPDGRYIMSTLAVADDPPLVAVKSLVLNPANPDRGLPQINGTVTLLDGSTGLLAAVVDGNWITGIRTAGLSAVAARRMARPDASVLALIGCGVQANTHLTAFSEMYPLTEVRAFGRGSRNRDALCERVRKMGYKAVASASGQEAVDGADLIVTSITLAAGIQPFLDAGGMKPGAFAAITDFARPWIRESMAKLDRVIVDDIHQETGSADPMVDPAVIRGDLQQLVTDQVHGRENDSEASAFVFRGLSIGDLALAAVAYRKARAAGAGSTIG